MAQINFEEIKEKEGKKSPDSDQQTTPGSVQNASIQQTLLWINTNGSNFYVKTEAKEAVTVFSIILSILSHLDNPFWVRC